MKTISCQNFEDLEYMKWNLKKILKNWGIHTEFLNKSNYDFLFPYVKMAI